MENTTWNGHASIASARREFHYPNIGDPRLAEAEKPRGERDVDGSTDEMDVCR